VKHKCSGDGGLHWAKQIVTSVQGRSSCEIVKGTY